MSSACGLADVLESVGVRVPLDPVQVVRCVERCGLAFMFAPHLGRYLRPESPADSVI